MGVESGVDWGRDAAHPVFPKKIFQKFALELGVQTVAVFVMGYGCAQRSARE